MGGSTQEITKLIDIRRIYAIVDNKLYAELEIYCYILKISRTSRSSSMIQPQNGDSLVEDIFLRNVWLLRVRLVCVGQKVRNTSSAASELGRRSCALLWQMWASSRRIYAVLP